MIFAVRQGEIGILRGGSFAGKTLAGHNFLI